MHTPCTWQPSEQPDAVAVRELLLSLEARAAAVWQLAAGTAGTAGTADAADAAHTADATGAAVAAGAAHTAEAAVAAVAELRRGLERFVMERLHARVFGLGMDVVEDKVLQAQVRT